MTQFELGEKATKHFVVNDYCEMLVTIQRANSACQSLLLLNIPWALKKAESLCGGRNYLVALESGIPITDYI